MTASTTTSHTSSARAPQPPEGSSLYYAWRLVPTRRQAALRAWWQWWHEISSIPFDVQDPGVAETKLRWWLQEVQQATQGQAQHPTTQYLFSKAPRDVLMAHPEWLTTQIEGQIQLVHQTRWLDEASLKRHIEHTTSQACVAAAALLGATTPEAWTAAKQLGQGIRQAHQLARLGQDARAGWVHVPIDVLQQHDVKAHELTKPAPQAGPNWPKLRTHLCEQATQHIRAGLQGIRALPRRQRRALVPLIALAHMQLGLLDVINAGNDRILHERLLLTPVRKWWIAAQVRLGWLR